MKDQQIASDLEKIANGNCVCVENQFKCSAHTMIDDPESVKRLIFNRSIKDKLLREEYLRAAA